MTTYLGRSNHVEVHIKLFTGYSYNFLMAVWKKSEWISRR